METGMNYIEALAKVLENVHILEEEEKPLLKSQGQILAKDVYSDIDVPPTDTSAMDGYAVRAEDIMNASRENPVRLRVVQTVIAGHLPRKIIKAGTAARIMTGAVMPDGADCVVKFEDASEEEVQARNRSWVDIYLPVKSGSNVRKLGENVIRGSLILSRGKTIGPAEIAVLSSIGRAKVPVIRRPLVAVLSSGEELISLNKTQSQGKAYDSNTLAIAALVTHYGGIPRILGVARDNEKSIRSKIQRGLSADAIVSSGGVSRGDYDLIRDVVAKSGRVLFSGVKISPGEPFSFGVVDKPRLEKQSKVIPFFALAGNPTACILNFELFVRPAMLKMRGFQQVSHPVVESVMEDILENKKDVQKYIWVKLEKQRNNYLAKIAGSQKRGVLTSVARANGLAVVPANTTIKKGDIVTVMLLTWQEG
jgi:molybdopterin molybdotransferase